MSWNTLPTCSASAVRLLSTVSTPFTVTLPKKSPARRCGTRPLSACVSVVLPAPLGPVTPMKSPSSTVMSMLCSASRLSPA